MPNASQNTNTTSPTPSTPSAGLSQREKDRRLGIGFVAGVFVLTVLVVGLFQAKLITNPIPGLMQSAQGMATQLGELSQLGKVSSTESSTLSDAESLELLQNDYRIIGEFDISMTALAEHYNATYYADLGTRSAAQQDLAQFRSTIDSIESGLSWIQNPSFLVSSNYATALENLKQCHADLLARADVVLSSYAVSLAYEDVVGHEEEINAPVVAVNDENGISVYKLDFDATYQIADPTLVE